VKWNHSEGRVSSFVTASVTFKAPISMRLLDFDVGHLCSDCSLIEQLKNNNVDILEILPKQLLWLLELIELLDMANQTHRKIGV
jgi:hypothetical protein